MPCDQVVRQSEVSEAEAPSVDGGDGEGGGGAVPEVQGESAADVQPEPVGGGFADRGRPLVCGERGEGTARHARVPGAGEPRTGDALCGVLLQAHPHGRPYDLSGGGDTGRRADRLHGRRRNARPLRAEHPGGADAVPGLGARGVADGRLEEEDRAGHANEQGERGDDGGHPGGVSPDVRGGQGAHRPRPPEHARHQEGGGPHEERMRRGGRERPGARVVRLRAGAGTSPYRVRRWHVAGRGGRITGRERGSAWTQTRHAGTVTADADFAARPRGPAPRGVVRLAAGPGGIAAPERSAQGCGYGAQAPVQPCRCRTGSPLRTPVRLHGGENTAPDERPATGRGAVPHGPEYAAPKYARRHRRGIPTPAQPCRRRTSHRRPSAPAPRGGTAGAQSREEPGTGAPSSPWRAAPFTARRGRLSRGAPPECPVTHPYGVAQVERPRWRADIRLMAGEGLPVRRGVVRAPVRRLRRGARADADHRPHARRTRRASRAPP